MKTTLSILRIAVALVLSQTLTLPVLRAQMSRGDREALLSRRPAPKPPTSVSSVEDSGVPSDILTGEWDALAAEMARIEQADTSALPAREGRDSVTAPTEFSPEGFLRSCVAVAAQRCGLDAPYETVLPHVTWFCIEHRRGTAVMLARFASREEMIRREFAARGVPEDLAVLCIVESGMNPGAVSPAGAAGLWQFMPQTATGYGLTVNSVRDDRFDPAESTPAAARFLRDLHLSLGSWTLATAAYNCGAGRVQEAVRKAGSDRFADILPYLPEETRDYVPRVIAATFALYFSEMLKPR
jgi:membrane-bound lytic murein transglycosylase D